MNIFFFDLPYSTKVGNEIELKGRMLDEMFAIKSKPKDVAMGIRLQQVAYVQNWGDKVPQKDISE